MPDISLTTVVVLCLAAAAAGWIDAVVGGGGLLLLPALLLGLPHVPAAARARHQQGRGDRRYAGAAVTYLRKTPVDVRRPYGSELAALAGSWAGRSSRRASAPTC